MIFRSAQEIWETALGELQIQVSRPNYRTWLEKTSGLDYQGNDFIIGVPNTFVAEYLDTNQRSMIEKTLINLTQQPDIKAVFKVNGKLANSSPKGKVPQAALNLNPSYTFDAFVAGNATD